MTVEGEIHSAYPARKRYIAWAVILLRPIRLPRATAVALYVAWYSGCKADKATRRAALYLLHICRCTQACSWTAAAICVQMYFHTLGSCLEMGRWTGSTRGGAYLTGSAKSKTKDQSQFWEHVHFVACSVTQCWPAGKINIPAVLGCFL